MNQFLTGGRYIVGITPNSVGLSHVEIGEKRDYPPSRA